MRPRLEIVMVVARQANNETCAGNMHRSLAMCTTRGTDSTEREIWPMGKALGQPEIAKSNEDCQLHETDIKLCAKQE